MANNTQRRGVGLWPWLLVVLITCVQALPAHEYEYRDLHPVYDMGLSPAVVRDVEAKHGFGNDRWVALPKDAEEDELWTLQKRYTWQGPCGNATDAAFFVTNTYNRIFQFRCSYNGSPGINVMAGSLIVIAANLMDCADRCASTQYWSYAATASCRNVELRNNGECRMFNSFVGTTTITYAATASNSAWATFVTQVDCNPPDTNVFSPLFTPCGTMLAGTIPNPSTTIIAPGTTSTYTFSQYSNWATRTPSSTISQATACVTIYPFNNVCLAS